MSGSKQSDSKLNTDLPGRSDKMSSRKTSATKPVQIPTNTTYVERHVPFWRDQRFWIQIAIICIMHLIILCVYMGVPAKINNEDVDIAIENKFKDLLDGYWKIREKKLTEAFDTKIKGNITQLTEVMESVKSETKGKLTPVKKELEEGKQPSENYLNGIIKEKTTQLTESMEKVKSEVTEELNSVKREWEKREQTLKRIGAR